MGLFRECPKCKKNISYVSKYVLKNAEKHQSVCKSCSARLRKRQKQIYIHQCEFCSQTVSSKKKQQRFCSRKCLHAFLRQLSEKPKEERNCITCETSFRVTFLSKKKYCSQECARKGSIGRLLTDVHKKQISDTRKRDWACGEVYENVKAARTKWHDYEDRLGRKLRLQGTWELAFAKWLDLKCFSFVAHKGCIWYQDVKGDSRVYLPDFWVDEWKCYVDVKNDYLFSRSHEKINSIQKTGVPLKILLKSDLIELGVFDVTNRENTH